MLDQREKGFAARLLADVDTQDSAKGPSHERSLGAEATNLRIWYKTGRQAPGLPWSSYVTDEWDDGDDAEKLTLVFASRYVIIFGHHLLSLVRQIDEGRLKSITEVDGLRAQQMMAENASIREESKKTAVVTRVEVGPAIETLVTALKGEEDNETGYVRRVK